MNKKIILLIIITSVIYYSCDKRKDYFYQYNLAPEFGIKKLGLGGSFSSSISDSVWTTSFGYKCEYSIKDEPSDVQSYSYNVTLGSGVVTFDQALKQISVSGLSMGKNIFELLVTDKYGKISTCNLELLVFANRAPVAKLTVIQTNASSPREIKISTPLSYDLDTRFGDYIQEYQFKVGSTYTVNTPFNQINYIAATTGTVMVTLKIKDSKGIISNKDSLIFNIL